MTDEEKLTLLKSDLQMLTSANDVFLKSLIETAKAAIQREGITLVENDMDIDMAVGQYAAHLFRKRDAGDKDMTRFFRERLKNKHFSQHRRGGE